MSATTSPQFSVDEYRVLVESFAQAIWEADSEGVIRTDSPSWRAYTGQSLDEWLSGGWLAAIHPDNQADALCQWQEAIQKRTPFNAELRLQSPDGGWRWSNVRATQILYPDGSVKKWVGLTIDISDKKKAEEALRQQQSRLEERSHVLLRSTEEVAQTGSYEADLQQNTLRFSDGMYRLFGEEPGAIDPSMAWIDSRSYPEDVQSVRQTLNTATASLQPYYYRRRIYRKDGELRQLEAHGRVVSDRSGRAERLIGLVQDITERHQIEQDLIQTKTLLQTIFDTSPNSITAYTPVYTDDVLVDFKIALANAFTQQTTGINPTGQLLTQTFPTAQHNGLLARLKQVLEQKEKQDFELWYEGEGMHHWFRMIAVPMDSMVLVTTEDVTERKKVEAEVLRLNDEMARKVTDRYYSLFNTIQEGMNVLELIYDDNGKPIDFRWLEVNPAFEKITGLTNVAGKLVSETIPTEQYWFDTYDRVIKTGEPLRYENYHAGLQQWFRTHTSRIGGAGSLLVANVFEDITQQKRQEANLVFLANLMTDFAPLGSVDKIMDMAGRRIVDHLGLSHCTFVAINPEASECTILHDSCPSGLSVLTGTLRLADFHTDEENRLLAGGSAMIVNNIMAGPRSAEQIASFRAIDVASLVNTPIVNNGRWVFDLGVTRSAPSVWLPDEIELLQQVASRIWLRIERARAEEALYQSQKRLQKAIDIETVGVLFFDQQGVIHDANAAFEHMSGLRHEDLVSGKVEWHKITPPEFRAVSLKAMNELITQGQSVPYEKEYVRLDGSRWWGLFAGKRLSEHEIVEFVIDITDSKRAQQALQQSVQRKDEFLAMLAHELRNPMATIRSGLQVLTLTCSDAMSQSTVAMMNRQTDHLVHMVDDLLDVNRITRGKIELKKERVNLVAVVQQAVDSIQPQFQQHHRTLFVDLPTVPLILDGDATRLHQVVTNLLTNGVRYSGEEGKVWLSLTQQGQQAVLQVRDNGIGLAADQLSVVFEPFVQAHQSLARSQGGLGLGLTLVNELVSLHGGRVAAWSPGPGLGSTFTVHLPTVAAVSDLPDQAPKATNASSAPRRLLVIDDNADAALTLSMLLKLKGYEVYTRHSGPAGIDAAESLRPSAILMDLGMPDMDGYETCRLIREQPWGRSVALIALTGYGQPEDRLRTQAAGFTGHLVKPVDMVQLMDLLDRLLAAD